MWKYHYSKLINKRALGARKGHTAMIPYKYRIR